MLKILLKIISEISRLCGCKTYLLSMATVIFSILICLCTAQIANWGKCLRKKPQLLLKSYPWKKVSPYLSQDPRPDRNCLRLILGECLLLIFPGEHDANKERTVLCTGRAPSDRGLLRRWEFTQVLSSLFSLTRYNIVAWWRNSPLWVKTGDLSLWLIEFRECRQKADSLTPFCSLHSLEHPGVHPAEPWLLAASCCLKVSCENRDVVEYSLTWSGWSLSSGPAALHGKIPTSNRVQFLPVQLQA